MFDTSPDALDPAGTLAAVADAQAITRLAEARILALAVHWADLNAVLVDESSLPGTERLVRFGGDGTPQVAEFAPAELGAVLGISTYAANKLVGDALDLRHRMPQLWSRVQAGEVKTWVARQIAQTTRDQTLDVALGIDAVVAPYADRKTAKQLEAICVAEAIRLDPDTAVADAESEQSGHGVWVDPSTDHGSKSIFIRTSSGDAVRFDAAIDRCADDLALLGDHRSKDQRRAAAIGVLAQPALALDTRAAAMAAATGQTVAVPPVEPPVQVKGSVFPTATLYVHLTDTTLTDRQGVARVEGIGPVLASQLKDMLRHDRVVVKPVIDLPNQTSVDGYEIPDRTREAVHLVMPTDTFPFATCHTRGMDLDHTTPYDDTIAFDDTGPPGQPGRTELGNLAPLTRRHHRIKTHGSWKVRQPFPGIVIWRTPTGRYYLVDNTGTRPIGTPNAA